MFESGVYCATCDTHLRPHAMKYFTAHNLLPLEAAPTVFPDSSSRERICSSHLTVTQPLRLPTEKYLLHPSALLFLQPGAFPGALGLSRNKCILIPLRRVQLVTSSPPGRWWVCHSTVTAQSQLGTWHLHVPAPGCPIQHSSALNWREQALWS